MAGYYLQLLTPKTMKLVGHTKSNTTKDKHYANVPHEEVLK